MKVSICIACHNQAHLLAEALNSCLSQDYSDIEIIVLDDASTDKTLALSLNYPDVKFYRSNEPSGSGGAFNKAIDYATGDIIYLLCADDFITDPRVITDVVNIFNKFSKVAHVSRYYYQFIDGDPRPVRAWRNNDILELANNPSGLAFRRSAIGEHRLTNTMFIEAPFLVNAIMKNKENYSMIMPWDTIAVRIHNSTARNKGYYKKRWTMSPVQAWTSIGCTAIQEDFTSLIQIKNYSTFWNVIKECWNFIRLKPLNLLEIGFWFYAFVAIFVPRFILIHVPHIYRITLGRMLTSEIKRK